MSPVYIRESVERRLGVRPDGIEHVYGGVLIVDARPRPRLYSLLSKVGPNRRPNGMPKRPRCEVCGKPIPAERVRLAIARGYTAKYDTDRCAATAARRRYRAKRKEEQK